MPDPSLGWTIVIPVKGTANAKSRLGAGREVAEAIALDTVEAAATVGRVIVVTPRSNSGVFADLGVLRVDDDGHGLNAAIARGLESAGSGSVAVLLGDLPALDPSQLRSTLAAAAQHPRAFVADAAGVGTVLITARSGERHAPAFGGASRAAHLAAGYVELAVDPASGLRRDVDTPHDLELLGPLLGRRTAAALFAAGGPRA